jgi:hypothetical protein
MALRVLVMEDEVRSKSNSFGEQSLQQLQFAAIRDSWPMAMSGYPRVELLGMWSWHAKAPQIAVSGISNSTFLRA